MVRRRRRIKVKRGMKKVRIIRSDGVLQTYWKRVNRYVKVKFPKRDFDLDGVPNRTDCVPLDPRHQDIGDDPKFEEDLGAAFSKGRKQRENVNFDFNEAIRRNQSLIEFLRRQGFSREEAAAIAASQGSPSVLQSIFARRAVSEGEQGRAATARIRAAADSAFGKLGLLAEERTEVEQLTAKAKQASLAGKENVAQSFMKKATVLQEKISATEKGVEQLQDFQNKLSTKTGRIAFDEQIKQLLRQRKAEAGFELGEEGQALERERTRREIESTKARAQAQAETQLTPEAKKLAKRLRKEQFKANISQNIATGIGSGLGMIAQRPFTKFLEKLDVKAGKKAALKNAYVEARAEKAKVIHAVRSKQVSRRQAKLLIKDLESDLRIKIRSIRESA